MWWWVLLFSWYCAVPGDHQSSSSDQECEQSLMAGQWKNMEYYGSFFQSFARELLAFSLRVDVLTIKANIWSFLKYLLKRRQWPIHCQLLKRRLWTHLCHSFPNYILCWILMRHHIPYTVFFCYWKAKSFRNLQIF